ncbi:hypothetical protein EVAR_25936_1 [Eumeta japonica]|uniref:Uncharacterized protein n=1 Tax=Eumeta variegata TaxID=151549 RepID=A0A4C1SCB7_EUMVA|nr:hypothetical protein EVAR_25936_1 [Eumeta japonica]
METFVREKPSYRFRFPIRLLLEDDSKCRHRSPSPVATSGNIMPQQRNPIRSFRFSGCAHAGFSEVITSYKSMNAGCTHEKHDSVVFRLSRARERERGTSDLSSPIGRCVRVEGQRPPQPTREQFYQLFIK